MPICRVCCALLLGCASSAPVAGQARFFRTLDARDGLAPSVVAAIAQSADGLIWIGTAGGLFRYDGTRIQRWTPDRLDTWVSTIATSHTGEVVVINETLGALLRVVPSGVREVQGPDGPVTGATQAAFDRAGGLWVAQGPRLLRRHPDSNDWQRIPLDSVDGTLPRTIVALTGTDVLVSTRTAVWRVHADGTLDLLAGIPDIVNALALPDGRILGLTFLASIVELGSHVVRSAPVGTGRAIALAERNGTLWVSLDRSLVAIGPTGSIETLAAPEGISGGGTLLVDRDGSLWMGSWSGLFIFPEPDTRVDGTDAGSRAESTVPMRDRAPSMGERNRRVEPIRSPRRARLATEVRSFGFGSPSTARAAGRLATPAATYIAASANT